MRKLNLTCKSSLKDVIFSKTQMELDIDFLLVWQLINVFWCVCKASISFKSSPFLENIILGFVYRPLHFVESFSSIFI